MKRFIAIAVAWAPLLLFAQYTVRGIVMDQNNGPLPLANVVLEGTRQAAVTGSDGSFVIEGVPKGTFSLKVSYVGFQTYEQGIVVSDDLRITVKMEEKILQGEEVIVRATRANEKTPTTYTNISNKEIREQNMGQDLPFVLRFTPSMVVTSDAGNGVGYTGLRIRGSDATRINVTVNGVPLNDSESHGVFWVNMPDFASSTSNIQIQRGVGTSTNGAAAFGASVNLQTEMPSEDPYAKLDNSFGSFNTRKHTVEYNTGLIRKKWAFQGRLSRILSDGYIDRASSDLSSYYLSGGYYGKKTSLKAVTFAGKEVTYQSWWGTPQSRLENNVEGMQEVIVNNGYTEEQANNLLNSGRTFNYYLYENEVDNYQQDHYQLHFNHNFSRKFNVTSALHYTYGRGYYEQYKEDEDLSSYNISDIVLGDTISSSDLIRRRWLDNHFYGFTFSANYSVMNWDLTLGGAWNNYIGDHFGEVIWARFAGGSEIRDRYYDNEGRKKDFNWYLKGNHQITSKLNLYIDAQFRRIDYHTAGTDSDLGAIDTGKNYIFINPKAGFMYTISQTADFYASYAVGNREPVRNDFIDAPNGLLPKAETLRNLEVGYKTHASNYSFSANCYLMAYENQLVLTGTINDVGTPVRVNVPDSYRAGIELVAGVKFYENLSWSGNFTFSKNKIKKFTEVIYNYGPDFYDFIENQIVHTHTDISFSPEVIGSSQVTFKPINRLELSIFSKYVGMQYLDNTSTKNRSIDPYFTNDLKLDYTIETDLISEVALSFRVNNLLNSRYSSNGYTFGYAAGDYLVRENYYYPQAGVNFLASLSLTF